jgi:hypothetical protein
MVKKSQASTLRRLPIVLAVCVPLVHADDDCTFSQSGMLQDVERIAEQFPGASIDAERLRVTWVVENGDIEYYSVGGCYDLGGAVGRVSQLAEKRSGEAVSRVVLELARKFLPDAEAERISDAMESSSYDLGTSGSEDFMAIGHPLGEIVVSHRFAEGSDIVEVSWPVL